MLMKGKPKQRTIKQKIIRYVMTVALILGVSISSIMVISNYMLTDYVLLDTLQMMSKTSAQSVSANLHLLTDRMANLSLEKVLTDDKADIKDKVETLTEQKTRIEFVWLAVYKSDGSKMYGDDASPDSIASEKYYQQVTQTNATVIGEPHMDNDVMQLSVAYTLTKADSSVYGYLVGSYKYDMLNDVISTINLGKTGTAYILNEEGVIVADQNKDNIVNKVNFYSENSSGANDKIFDKIKDFQTGSTTFNLNGSTHYLAYSPVPGANWSLIIEAPKSEFLGVVVVAVAICIALAIIILIVSNQIIRRFAEKISRSLNNATNRLEEFAHGNLKDEVVIFNSGDEVEVLTKSLARTVHTLNGYIEDIENSLGAFSEGDYSRDIPSSFTGDFSAIRKSLESISDALNDTMWRVNDASLEVSRQSAEISEFAKQLSDGSEDQTHSMERLFQSIETVMNKSDEIDQNSKQVTERAQEANEKVKLGNSQMEAMVKAMNDISQNMSEITAISHMIGKIATQTKMLSLNAGIEAARAGEAGKGFAVVAQNIGALSAQTESALKQTSDIIALSAETIEKGVENAKATEESLKEIDEATVEFTHIASNLNQLVEAQKEVVTEMTAEINEVHAIASTNQDFAKKMDKKTEVSLEQTKQLEAFVSQVKLKKEGGRL